MTNVMPTDPLLWLRASGIDRDVQRTDHFTFLLFHRACIACEHALNCFIRRF